MAIRSSFLLLDLDDTILDYSNTGKQCWLELCPIFAARLGVNVESLISALYQSSEWYWSDTERHRLGRLDLKSARRQIVQLALDQLQIDFYELGVEMADTFTVQREVLVRPFDGAFEALQEFSDQGLRMALLTNGHAEFQRSKIQRFDLEKFFEIILIEGEIGFGKPDQRMFLLALEGLAAPPMQTWMIGNDLNRDIQRAQELGVSTVWVDFDQTGLPIDSPVIPTRIVYKLVEVQPLVYIE